MESILIYLLPVAIIVIIAVVCIKLIFDYLDNKKILMVLNYIDKKSDKSKISNNKINK